MTTRAADKPKGRSIPRRKPIASPTDDVVQAAESFRKQGRTGEARATIGRALAVDPQSLSALTTAAKIEVTAKDFQAALGIVDRLLAADPNSKAAVALRARCEQALESRAIDRAGADADAVDRTLTMVEARRRAGDLAGARELLQNVKGADQHPSALLISAKLDYAEQRYSQALASIDRLLELRPRTRAAEILKSACKERMLQRAQSSHRFDPNSFLGAIKSADKIRRSGDFVSARLALDKAAAANPVHPNVLIVSAQIYAATGQTAEALADVETLKLVLPDSDIPAEIERKILLGSNAAKSKMARTELNDWRIEHARQLAVEMSDTVERDLILGEISLLIGDGDDAADHARRALARAPFEVRAHTLLQITGGEGEARDYVARKISAGERPGTVADAFGWLSMLHAAGEITEIINFVVWARSALKVTTAQLPLLEAWRLRSLYGLGRYREVRRQLNSNPELATSAACSDVLVRALLQLGETRKAIETYRQAPPRASFKPLALQMSIRQNGPSEAYRLYRNAATARSLSRFFPDTFRFDPTGPVGPNGQILVADGGVGDEIRHAAIYPDIAAKASHTAISCDPRLQSLLQRSFPTLSFLPTARWRPETRSGRFTERSAVRGDQVCATITDNALWAKLEDASNVSPVISAISEVWPSDADFYSARAAYLKPDPAQVDEMNRLFAEERNAGRAVVGISWRSSMLSTGRNVHYTRISDWGEILRIPNITFVNLQPLLAEEEHHFLTTRADSFAEIEGLDLFDDFEGMAAAMVAMDAVVGAATTSIELAGAVGARGFFLANTYETAWRARPDGRDLWHPSVEVVRPAAFGDDGDMLAELARRLRRLRPGGIMAPEALADRTWRRASRSVAAVRRRMSF